MYKLNLKERLEEGKTIWHNLLEILDATFLAIVSGFAIYTYVHDHDHNLWDFSLGLAGVGIAFQAFLMFVKHLNKK